MKMLTFYVFFGRIVYRTNCESEGLSTSERDFISQNFLKKHEVGNGVFTILIRYIIIIYFVLMSTIPYYYDYKMWLNIKDLPKK